jgi:hypothetical protein
VRRGANDIAASAGLDNPPRIHDGDPVSNLDCHADVVGDDKTVPVNGTGSALTYSENPRG